MQVGAAHDEIRLPIVIGLLLDNNRRLCVSAILLAPVYILWINFNPTSNTAGCKKRFVLLLHYNRTKAFLQRFNVVFNIIISVNKYYRFGKKIA